MAATRGTAGARSAARTPPKVDRSACYAARYVAKHLVAEGLARRAEVALAYAIGVSQTRQRTGEHLRHRCAHR